MSVYDFRFLSDAQVGRGVQSKKKTELLNSLRFVIDFFLWGRYSYTAASLASNHIVTKSLLHRRHRRYHEYHRHHLQEFLVRAELCMPDEWYSDTENFQQYLW